MPGEFPAPRFHPREQRRQEHQTAALSLRGGPARERRQVRAPGRFGAGPAGQRTPSVDAPRRRCAPQGVASAAARGAFAPRPEVSSGRGEGVPSCGSAESPPGRLSPTLAGSTKKTCSRNPWVPRRTVDVSPSVPLLPLPSRPSDSPLPLRPLGGTSSVWSNGLVV